MSSVQQQVQELAEAVVSLKDQVDQLQAGYLRNMNHLHEWGLRVRRDILIYELYLRSRHGPQFQQFLDEGYHGEDWSLSADMSAEDSQEMNARLVSILNEKSQAGDPGDPPMPPFL